MKADNAIRGLSLLRADTRERTTAEGLLLSAEQSAVHRGLAAREAAGLIRRLTGDSFKKTTVAVCSSPRIPDFEAAWSRELS